MFAFNHLCAFFWHKYHSDGQQSEPRSPYVLGMRNNTTNRQGNVRALGRITIDRMQQANSAGRGRLLESLKGL